MVERRYTVGTGYLDGGPAQSFAAANLAAAIIVDWKIRNIHVYENARSGVQHWREDCPAGRRSRRGKTKLVPREVGLTKPCGVCASVERHEQARRDRWRVRRLLAIEPPRKIDALEAAERAYRMTHLALVAGS